MAREMQIINTEQGQVKLIHEDDIVEGHLWCEHCKYNNNCEEVLKNCVNVILMAKFAILKVLNYDYRRLLFTSDIKTP